MITKTHIPKRRLFDSLISTKGWMHGLGFHLIEREEIPLVDDNAKRQHIKFFERSCPKGNTAECKSLLHEAQGRFSSTLF